MKTRIISACVMLPLLILVYLGGYPLMAAAFLVGAIGLHEFYHGFEAAGTKPCMAIGYTALVALYALNLAFPSDLRFVMVWIVLVVMASMIYGFNVEERKLQDMTATLLGVLYVVFFSFHIVLIDQTADSDLIWLVFLAAFGTDIMAYFVGMAIGKHKLCPVVSPKKTVEGAIGGVLGTMVFGVVATLIYSIAANRMEAFTRSNIGVSMYVIIALLGCIAAVLGIYGDLFASVVKRQCGIKDYGTIFPGHGGILDRFDSVMFIAPFVTMVITAVFYA